VRRWFARILFWLTAVPLALVAAAFAIANRATVAISLDPAPFILEAPLYAIALGGLALGLLLGLALTWPALARWRGVARARARSVATLEDEVARLNRERAAKSPPGTAVVTVPGNVAPT
jgi:uncharacterized integral membrane protein